MMIGLSNIGVNIGPLIAGAGVIGLAIGFGAQKLVQDIVSGVFFLVDDAFRVGEYIEFGDMRGEVEGISLRSLKLRHHRGAAAYRAVQRAADGHQLQSRLDHLQDGVPPATRGGHPEGQEAGQADRSGDDAGSRAPGQYVAAVEVPGHSRAWTRPR